MTPKRLIIYGVEKRFKMQLLLGLKGSPLVGVRIVNFVPPEVRQTAHCGNAEVRRRYLEGDFVIVRTDDFRGKWSFGQIMRAVGCHKSE